MIKLKVQALEDMFRAARALDAAEILIDKDRDLGFLWSPDRGAAIAVKLWGSAHEGQVPMDILNKTLGNPETPHESELGRADAVAVAPGREVSPLVRAALADVRERRRLAQVHGAKDKTVEIEIGGGFLRIGMMRIEAPCWGTAVTAVNGGYLMTAIDHAFGMTAHGVQLEIHESGVLRVLMQSPNQQTEPDTRWRGQAVIAPVVNRDRLEGRRKTIEYST
jgi:hypothetical protein